MAKNRIIVSERDNIAALFEGDQAAEFIINRSDILLGDVYLVSVENILPSIDAAFVNVGYDKMGFLHASDTPGKGDLKNRLQPKQQLLVQVIKEPTGHKGPRVTSNISLPGRFLVLMPESKGISISRKIEQPSERARLKSALSLLKPAGVGVIIRTEANGQKDSDVQEDFEILMERWQNIVSMSQNVKAPALLYRDQDLLYRVIREAVTEDIEELIVDTSFGYQRAQQLLANWKLDKNLKVSQYTGNQSIMVELGVDREIRQALQTKVPLPSGGYLYIQPTEALTVIDVNSGRFTRLDSQAQTIKQTNLEAAKEIARQLRLRNIGGMIIVDFIDMESRGDKLTVLEAFEQALAPDKAKPQVGQLSDLGLVEMTRHRQGKSLHELFTHRCSVCAATGHAVEDLNWAPPNVDIDAARGGARMNQRSRLPLRQSRQQQQQGGKQRSGARFPNLQQPETVAAQQNGNKLTFDVTRLGATTPLFGANGLGDDGETMPLIRELQGKPRKQTSVFEPGHRIMAPEGIQLADFVREHTMARLGVVLSREAKFANTPPEFNSQLGRINPRANDVISLVIAMSESGPQGRDDDRDDDDEDDEDFHGEASSDEESKPEKARHTRREAADEEADDEAEEGSDDESADATQDKQSRSRRGRRGGRGRTRNNRDNDGDAPTEHEVLDTPGAVAVVEADASQPEQPADQPAPEQGNFEPNEPNGQDTEAADADQAEDDSKPKRPRRGGRAPKRPLSRGRARRPAGEGGEPSPDNS